MEDRGPISAPMPEGKPDLTHWVLPPTSFYWQTAAGYRLHLRYWHPERAEDIRGLCFWLHGYQQHLSRPELAPLFEALTSHGLGVIGYEIMGHGYSPGERALVNDIDELATQWVDFIRIVRSSPSSDDGGHKLGLPQAILAAMQKVKFFVLGESLGGLLAMIVSTQLWHAKTDVITGFGGCLVCAPALRADLPPAPVQWLLRTLVAPIFPSYIMPAFISKSATIPAAAMFKDEAMRRDYELDDFGEAKGALGWKKGMKWATAAAFMRAFSACEERFALTEFPFCILHDPGDAITFYSGCQALMAASPSKDKSLIDMPDCLHEIVANNMELALSKMLEWLMKKL